MSGYSDWLIQNMLDANPIKFAEQRAMLDAYIENLETRESETFLGLQDFLEELQEKRLMVSAIKICSGYKPK
jgi:beta-phosphoglucomutase-like phosphatase (HAD superfamily)